MRRPGIAGRVFLYTAAIVVAVLGAAVALAAHSGRRTARAAERRGLEQAADLTAQLLAGRGRTLAGGARVFVQGPYFRSLVAQRQRDDILDQAFEAAEQIDADWVFITDERGVLLAKSDEPGAFGAPMGEIPLVAGALEGRRTSGYGVSRDSLLFQAVAEPIVVPGAAPVGVLVATKLVDRQLALDVRAATGADVLFYTLGVDGTPHTAATSLGGAAQASAILPPPSSLTRDARANTAPAPTSSPRNAEIDEVTYALQGTSLTTAGGAVVGGFVIARPENMMPGEMATARRSLLFAGALGFVLALLAAWSAARHVTRPARSLTRATEHALHGDYDAAARIATQATDRAPHDEIAALGAGLAELLVELREKQSLIAVLRRATPQRTGEADREDSTADAHLADSGDENALPSPTPSPMRRAGARARVVASTTARAAKPRFTLRPPGALSPGAVVADRYTIDAVLGAGGTGIVYKAMDGTLGSAVALKVLRPELLADDDIAREALEHALRLTHRVSHRNVVRTFDFGFSRGVPFFTMECVEGASLASILAHRGALPSDAVTALARQLVRGVGAAHEHGVVHGDLKPANILVAVDGTLKITDFGVATLVRRPMNDRVSFGDSPLQPPRLTGAIIGTPEYMAPEVLLGAAPDARADIYSMGVVIEECLSGDTPFTRDAPRDFLARKLELASSSASAQRGELPRTLAEMVAWMTASDAANRPRTTKEVASSLLHLD